MSDQIRLVISACECITTDIGWLKVLIQVRSVVVVSLESASFATSRSMVMSRVFLKRC